MKSTGDLQALLKQRTWDKEVFLWRSSERSLLEALGSAKYVGLDLLDLFDPDCLPADDEATREALIAGLRQRLRAMPKGPQDRTVLLVKSIGLLARYKTGLKEFYDWFVGSYTMITPEAQAELQVDGGIFSAFAPSDKRTSQERAKNAPPRYSFPHKSAASTRRVHKIAYGGEVVACDRWRDEFGEEIKNADQHFRIAYLCTRPEETDEIIAAALKDARVVVCRPDALNQESRDALTDMLAAEEMKKNCAAPNQGSLREYADGKRRDAIKTILKCQQDEFRRGRVLTQKGYGIPAIEVFAQPKEREELLAARILEKSYDVPLFSPKDLKKDFTDNDARKLFAGLFTKEPAGAEKDAVINFGPGMELTEKSNPSDYNPEQSQAIKEIRGILATRPIYHSSDMAIRGHVFCSFLALLLAKELEDRLRRHGVATEWGDILRDLDRLQEIQLEQDGKRFLLRTPTTGVAGKLFQAVGVSLPPNLQELPLTTPQPAA